MTFYAGPNNKWFLLNGTQLNSMTLSTLNVTSSITSSYYFGNGSYLIDLPAVSSLSLTSTIEGLGTLGFISTAQLTSSIIGLGTLGYLSSVQPSLNSTVEGLGSLGFLSSINSPS